VSAPPAWTPGIPPRVLEIRLAQFDALNSRAVELRALGHDVISLGQAIPGFAPPVAALDASRRAIEDGSAHIYSTDAGLRSLREVLCERLRESFHIEATADDVIVTAGANQAFMLAMLTLVSPGDEVVLPAPYFANHEMAVRAVSAVPREAPLPEESGFSVEWSHIEEQLTPRTRAVVLCTPSNPTGAVVPARALERIATELARRSMLLICDETYMHFVYTADGHCSAAALPRWRENVVVIGTFSKSFGMTGWRVGYMLADRSVCDQAIKIQDAMIICAPVASQVGVEAAIRTQWGYAGAFHGELLARRAILAERVASIPSLHWAATEGAFFAFVRVEGCRDSDALARHLLETAHVVTIPGVMFGRAGEGFLRLSYGSAPRAQLTQAFDRLGAYFRDR
jgi:aminotransferase